MLQRIAISMTEKELRRLVLLQKRFGARSRSELVRELVIRFEKLENQWNMLSSCLRGYLEVPEAGRAESQSVLKASVSGQAFEEW